MAARNVVGAAPCVQWAAQMKVLISTWSRPAVEGRGGALSSTLRAKEPELQIKQSYRETLKGSSQVGRICGGKIAFFCLQKVNKTQLFHPTSHSLGPIF